MGMSASDTDYKFIKRPLVLFRITSGARQEGIVRPNQQIRSTGTVQTRSEIYFDVKRDRCGLRTLRRSGGHWEIPFTTPLEDIII